VTISLVGTITKPKLDLATGARIGGRKPLVRGGWRASRTAADQNGRGRVSSKICLKKRQKQPCATRLIKARGTRSYHQRAEADMRAVICPYSNCARANFGTARVAQILE